MLLSPLSSTDYLGTFLTPWSLPEEGWELDFRRFSMFFQHFHLISPSGERWEARVASRHNATTRRIDPHVRHAPQTSKDQELTVWILHFLFLNCWIFGIPALFEKTDLRWPLRPRPLVENDHMMILLLWGFHQNLMFTLIFTVQIHIFPSNIIFPFKASGAIFERHLCSLEQTSANKH